MIRCDDPMRLVVLHCREYNICVVNFTTFLLLN